MKIKNDSIFTAFASNICSVCTDTSCRGLTSEVEISIKTNMMGLQCLKYALVHSEVAATKETEDQRLNNLVKTTRLFNNTIGLI